VTKLIGSLVDPTYPFFCIISEKPNTNIPPPLKTHQGEEATLRCPWMDLSLVLLTVSGLWVVVQHQVCWVGQGRAVPLQGQGRLHLSCLRANTKTMTLSSPYGVDESLCVMWLNQEMFLLWTFFL